MINNLYSFIFCGLAGSGKGTQRDIIEGFMPICHVSPGDILREQKKSGTLEEKYQTMLKSGKLLPPDFVSKIVLEEIDKLQQKSEYKGVIFDGYPRSLEQCRAIDNSLSKNEKIDAFFFLDIKEDVLIERLINRFYCANCDTIYNKLGLLPKIKNICDKCGLSDFINRDDDSEIEAIKSRFAIFHHETSKVINLYKERGICHVINASLKREEVTSQIIDILKDFINEQ